VDEIVEPYQRCVVCLPVVTGEPGAMLVVDRFAILMEILSRRGAWAIEARSIWLGWSVIGSDGGPLWTVLWNEGEVDMEKSGVCVWRGCEWKKEEKMESKGLAHLSLCMNSKIALPLCIALSFPTLSLFFTKK
jgi:hypothetical protein